MSNWTRKVMREQKKKFVKDFCKKYSLTDESLAGICFQRGKKSAGLEQKFDVATDIEIDMLEKAYEAKLVEASTTTAEEDNGTTKED